LGYFSYQINLEVVKQNKDNVSLQEKRNRFNNEKRLNL